jgi:hypothetical protein
MVAAISAAALAVALLPPDENVQGLARVMRMGAALAEVTRDLLDAGNAYAAAALLSASCRGRVPLVDDPDDAARMRERSAGWFSASEYQAHCDQGGHPSPTGSALFNRKAEPDPVRLLWLDFGHHLMRGWDVLVSACAAVDRAGAVRRDALLVTDARERWTTSDSLA